MIRSVRGLMVVLLLVAPREVGAEWQFKPFLGLTFGPFTTYVDPDVVAGSVPDAEGVDAGSSHLTYGVGVTLLGEVLGLEFDLGRTPGFFEGERGIVEDSGVQTLTGNVVVAVPRRLSQYTLRPYVAAGIGTMTIKIQDGPPLTLYDVEDRVAVMDIGGGATGFLSDRVGVSWDLRYFRAVGYETGVNVSEDGQLSFWRANMALVLRY